MPERTIIVAKSRKRDSNGLDALLEHLSSVLVKGRLSEIEQLDQRALSWETVERLPLVLSYPLPDDLPFQPYPHSEIFGDPEKMLFNELVHAFGTSIACRDRLDDDLPCTVRANYGTVVVASMYGATVQQVEENPPWVVHEADHGISLEAVLDQDPEDLTRGWCPRVVDTYRAYGDLLARFPDLEDVVTTVLPDLQGPIDNLELIVGSGLFAQLYAESALVDRALEAVARTQIAVARHLAGMIGDGLNGFSHQHAAVVKGNILVRNDSAILMSPEMYAHQVAPHDACVLNAMGGGGIHACGGMGPHIPVFLDVPACLCLDIGQPELNDLDRAYALGKEKQIALIRTGVSEEELLSGSVLDRFPTGATLLHAAPSLPDAQRIMEGYRRAADNRRRAHSR